MPDPSLALQKAVVTKLRLIHDNVFDRVPEDNPFPRITIGEGQVLPDNSDCRRGSEVTLQVDVWSRAVGFPEAKDLASQVRDALDDARLQLDGHLLDLIEFDNSQVLRDPDGITSHIALTFRALTQPNT